MAKRLFISNSNTVKVVVKLVIFVILLLAFNLGLSYVLEKMYFSSLGGNSGAQINYTLKQRSPIVIFGASRVMHHYSPQILKDETGYDTYNAGDDGKNSTYQLGLLEMLLTQYKPRVIVYEGGDFTNSLDGGTIDLYPYYYHYQAIKDLLNNRDKYASWKFQLHLYAYNQKILTILRGYIDKTKPNVSGFNPTTGNISQEEIDQYYKNLSSRVEQTIDPKAYRNFVSFIELCKKNNIILILTDSPRMFREQFETMKKVDSLAVQFRIPYFDYSHDPQFIGHRNLFKDADHLNKQGAILFSEEFGKDLNQYLNNNEQNK